MAYHLTHLTNVNGPQALFNAIRDFMINTLGWTLKKSGTISGSYGKDYVILYSDGESGQEDIYVGLNWYYYTDQRCGVQLNGYTGFDSAYDYDNLGNLRTDKANGVYRYQPSFLLQDTNYDHVWLGGDKDCCFGVIRCVTLYPCFYTGLLRRYWSRQFDPYPVYIFGSFGANGAGTTPYPYQYDWNSSSVFKGFGSDLYYRNYLWYNQDEWHYNFRFSPDDPGTGVTWRHSYVSATKKIFTANMFIHCVTLPGNERAVSPFIIADETGMRGEIKWVYKLSKAQGLDPEDEVTIDSITYKVFPGNVDLTVTKYYAVRMT